jgi:hypothetical protein
MKSQPQFEDADDYHIATKEYLVEFRLALESTTPTIHHPVPGAAAASPLDTSLTSTASTSRRRVNLPKLQLPLC